MIHGIEIKNKIKKEKKGLPSNKDYITEAYLQGGKAIGILLKKKHKKNKT